MTGGSHAEDPPRVARNRPIHHRGETDYSAEGSLTRVGVNFFFGTIRVALGKQAFRLGANGGHVQIFTRALRDLGFTVTEDVVAGNVVRSHEIHNKPDQGMELLGGGSRLVEIADQTDSDAVGVVSVVEGVVVRAPFLDGPAGADFDLSVAAVGAVANDKVISELIKAAVAVPAVDNGGRPIGTIAVMNDDPGPVVRANFGNPSRGNAGNR